MVIKSATALRNFLALEPFEIPTEFTQSLPDYQRLICELYEDSPLISEAVIPHYSHFIDELKYQFGIMLRRGVNVEFCDEDPTPLDENGKISSRLLREEYTNTGIMRIYRSDGSHPILDLFGMQYNPGGDLRGARFETMNSIFRAVHDYLGHFATGAGFNWKGETTAYYSHACTFTLSARKALFCETVAQQSCYAVRKDYPAQKAVFYAYCDMFPPLK